MRWLSWFCRWWYRPQPTLDHLQVVLYTRQGCHLCEEAWQRLELARHRYGFRLASVDVDSDPELRARYDTCVPVVTVNGRVRFRGGLNSVLLERLLRAEHAR
jgi:glutaredoxin